MSRKLAKNVRNSKICLLSSPSFKLVNCKKGIQVSGSKAIDVVPFSKMHHRIHVVAPIHFSIRLVQSKFQGSCPVALEKARRLDFYVRGHSSGPRGAAVQTRKVPRNGCAIVASRGVVAAFGVRTNGTRRPCCVRMPIASGRARIGLLGAG